jgi:hypothetical protein
VEDVDMEDEEEEEEESDYDEMQEMRENLDEMTSVSSQSSLRLAMILMTSRADHPGQACREECPNSPTVSRFRLVPQPQGRQVPGSNTGTVVSLINHTCYPQTADMGMRRRTHIVEQTEAVANDVFSKMDAALAAMEAFKKQTASVMARVSGKKG